MKYAYDIIKKPIITERSMMGAQDNKYTFEVAIAAGKVAAANIDQYLGYNHEITCDVKIPEPDLSDRTPCGRVNLTERPAGERN